MRDLRTHNRVSLKLEKVYVSKDSHKMITLSDRLGCKIEEDSPVVSSPELFLGCSVQ